MIFYDDKYYESFEDILEDIYFGGIDNEEDLVISYQEARLEKVIDFDIGYLVELLLEDRDDEEGETSLKVTKLFYDNINVEKIREGMPSLYYPIGYVKIFDLRELDVYKEYLESKEPSNG